MSDVQEENEEETVQRIEINPVCFIIAPTLELDAAFHVSFRVDENVPMVAWARLLKDFGRQLSDECLQDRPAIKMANLKYWYLTFNADAYLAVPHVCDHLKMLWEKVIKHEGLFHVNGR